MFAEIVALVKKEFLMEWRQKYALSGLLLYVLSAVFVSYLSFGLRLPEPITWNALFWIILLFSAINAIGKSFQQEREGRFFFYYQLAGPVAIIVSKMIYNSLLMLFLAFLGYLVFATVLQNPVQDQGMFLLNLALGSISFATGLTLISGIASKAGSGSILMAILGFPVILPVVLMLIKTSKNAVDGLGFDASADELLTISAINLIVIAVSVLLFPYLWRS